MPKTTKEEREAMQRWDARKAAEKTAADIKAFTAMNQADPDFGIDGGAIVYSEFSYDMSPKQQGVYKDQVLTQLDAVHRTMGEGTRFKDWLSNVDTDLVKENAARYDEIKFDKDILNEMDPKEFSVLQNAGMLMALLDKHTGNIEDVRDIIGEDVPRPIEEYVYQKKQGNIEQQ